MGNKIHAFDIGILGEMDATEIATQIHKKNISQKEVISCAIERAKKVGPSLNAIVTDCFDEALNKSYSSSNGPFKGVPTFIKDQLHVKGLPTLFGSKAVPPKIHKKHEKATKQILSTGCVVLGKSSTSEFGFLPAVEPLLHPATQNPHGLDYSTGGSSGGAAALVAAGVVPFAHAADGGGSIRIPAACCGLVGLKPSRGRDIESPTGLLPIDIVCQGIVTRSVRDSATYYSAIEKYYAHPKLPRIGQDIHPIKKRLKIGMFIKPATHIYDHIDVDNAVLNAGKFCEGLGHEVELISNPFSPEVKIDFISYWSFLAFTITKFGKAMHGLGFDKSKLEDFTKQLAKSYPKVLGSSFGALKRLKNFQNYYSTLFNKYDVLLSPVLSHSTPKIGYFSPDNHFFSTLERLSQYAIFTKFQNVAGAPAISLPMGKCQNDLPIGVQFAANIGEDRMLLELALEIEAHGGLLNWTKIIQE